LSLIVSKFLDQISVTTWPNFIVLINILLLCNMFLEAWSFSPFFCLVCLVNNTLNLPASLFHNNFLVMLFFFYLSFHGLANYIQSLKFFICFSSDTAQILLVESSSGFLSLLKSSSLLIELLLLPFKFLKSSSTTQRFVFLLLNISFYHLNSFT